MVFVGRTDQLAVLGRALDEARAGRGGTVLIAGDPGIGKTTIAEAFAARARAQQANVVWARCDVGAGAPILWPWVEALHGCLDQLGDGELQQIVSAGGDELAYLLPERFHRSMATAPATLVDSPDAQFRLFHAVLHVLAAAARHRPLVIVLDDLQAADRTSLLLTRFVVRRVRESALLIVITCRDIPAEGDPILGDAVADILRASGTERVQLAGFTAAEVQEYVDREGGIETPAALATALQVRTEGNPLFVSEFVRACVRERQTGDMLTALAALPPAVRIILTRRVAAVSPECRMVLEVAASFGHECTVELLSAVVGASAPDGQGATDAALTEARAACLIAAASPSQRRVRFSHRLIRDVVYDALSPARRQELHRAIATVLEQQPQRQTHLRELAHHLGQLDGEQERIKAIAYAEEAARHAASLAAYAEAAELYERALECNARMRWEDEGRRCELLLALGKARQAASDRAAARTAFAAAAVSARRLAAAGDAHAAERLGRAAVGFAGGWAGVGDVAQFDGDRAATFDAEAVSLLDEALHALEGADTAVRACVLSHLAVQRHFTASRAQRIELCRQAVDLARRCGDPATLGYVRCIDWVVGWSPDNSEERRAAADEIVVCAERAGDRSLQIGGVFQRLSTALELGDGEALQRDTQRAEELAAALRQPQWLWRMRAHAIALALMEGRLGPARELLNAARSEPLHDDSTARVFLALQLTELQRLLDRIGGVQSAAAFLKASIDQYPTVPSLRTRLAYLYVQLGRVDEARAELQYVGQSDFADLPRDLTWLNAMAEAAETCAALHDQRTARILYGSLLPYAHRHVVFLGGALSWGSVARLLGMLAATQHRWDEAAAHFETALTANRRIAARVWVAHTELAYGMMLRERDRPEDRSRAEYYLKQALITAEATGMAALRRQITPMASAGVPQLSQLHEPPRARHSAPMYIFRREGEVWAVGVDPQIVRMRHSKGLSLLERLLRNPGREFHVLDLMLSDDAAADAPTAARAMLAGDAGELLDDTAKAAYKARLTELRADLADAEDGGDGERAAMLREEIDALARQLSAAMGFGGRDRRAASAAERARTAVNKRIRAVIRKLEHDQPALSRHLRHAVKTGYFCSYAPEPETTVHWTFSGSESPAAKS